MLRLLFLLTLFIFTACDGTTTQNSARETVVDAPEYTQNYLFTFVDEKLTEFNATSTSKEVRSIVNYRDDRHITIKEVTYNKELQTTEYALRHFLFDTKKRLISLTVTDQENQSSTTFDYLYDTKGYLSQRVSNDHSSDVKYDTNAHGDISKASYQDQSGFNLYIYKNHKIKEIKFHDEQGKHYGSMTFQTPISVKTLMLLE